MKLITFLACIMMSLSIWSFTALAQTANPEPAGANPPSQDTFAQANNCAACARNMKENVGCQTGFNTPTCQKLYDGANKDKSTTPASQNGTVQ